MSAAETNQMVLEIAELLVSGFDDPPIACASKLDFAKLNFGIESLPYVDRYLLHVHRPYSNWINGIGLRPSEFEADTEDDAKELLKCTVIRCGAYVGEVVRRTTRSDLNWVRHQEWSKNANARDLDMIGRTPVIQTAFMLFENTRSELWVPLGKVLKFLEAGEEDSVAAFARVACSPPTELS